MNLKPMLLKNSVTSQISLKLTMTGHGNVTRRLFMFQCDCCLQGQTKRVASVCVYVLVCLFVYMEGRDPGPELPFTDYPVF